jgi:hypothetical protein
MNEFVWVFPEGGHELWNRNSTETVACDKEISSHKWIRPISGTKSWRRYAPLRSNAALFRTFVDLKPACILNFADRFGLLTDPEEGEPLAVWESAIADMRSAVECWYADPKYAPNHSDSVADLKWLSSEAQVFETCQMKHFFLAHGARDRDNVLFELGYLLGQRISNVRPVFNYDKLLDGFRLRLMPNSFGALQN